jgi:hypothetical protein
MANSKIKIPDMPSKVPDDLEFMHVLFILI